MVRNKKQVLLISTGKKKSGVKQRPHLDLLNTFQNELLKIDELIPDEIKQKALNYNKT